MTARQFAALTKKLEELGRLAPNALDAVAVLVDAYLKHFDPNNTPDGSPDVVRKSSGVH